MTDTRVIDEDMAALHREVDVAEGEALLQTTRSHRQVRRPDRAGRGDASTSGAARSSA